MNEVSCRAWSFFRAAEQAGFARADDLVRDLPADQVARLSHADERVDWATWAQICNRFGEHLGNDARRLHAAGALAIQPEFIGPLARVSPLFTNARVLLRIGAGWVAPSMYRSHTWEILEDTDVRFVVEIRLRPGLLASRAWFQLATGTLVAVPRINGQPDLVYEADITPTFARVVFHLPPPQTQVLGWMRNVGTAFTAPEVFASELLEQQRQIADQHHLLAEREEGFRNLLDALPGMVALVEGGHVLYANPALATALGRTPAALTGLAMQRFIHPEDREAAAGLILAATPGAPRVLRLINDDGPTLYVEASALEDVLYGGRPCRGLFAVDVTARTLAEQRLAGTRRTLDAALTVFPDLLLRLGPDGTVLDAHLGSAASGEFRRRDRAGLDLRALFQSKSHALADDDRGDLLALIRSGGVRNIRWTTDDGRVRDYEARVLPNAETGEAVAIVRDMTERADQERNRAQTERLTSLGTLAAGIAHEINNPLTSVATNLELASAALSGETPMEGGELRRVIDEAAAGSRRIAAIVGSLRVFLGTGAGTRAPVDPDHAVTEALYMTRNLIEHRARLDWTPGAPGPILGDEDRLVLVLVNLLQNAALAIPEGDPARHRVQVATAADDEHVRIEVTDTGGGIPDAIRDRIFDPFFTTRPVGEGSGLGLSIAQRVIADHGGTLAVQPGEGRGTRMVIHLPRAAVAAPAPTPSAPAAPAPPRGRVLIIDDEPLVANAIGRVLAAHHVQIVHDSDEALALLLSDEVFDVVICDLMLPGLSGAEVYQRATAARPALDGRFLFATGGAFTPQTQDFQEAHKDAVIEKPVRPKDLRARVAALLERRSVG